MLVIDSLNTSNKKAHFTPLPVYTGDGPYIEHQYRDFCAKHAINHLLQEEKVVRGNLSRLWINDNTGNPLANPNAKLSSHYCASEVARQEAIFTGSNDEINKPCI